MQFTEEEKAELRHLMDESHSTHIFRNNLENFFADILIKPAFEDYNGVKVYGGDKYWYIGGTTAFESIAHPDKTEPHQFATLEAAEDYIYKHVAVWSDSDIVAAVSNWSMYTIDLADIEKFLKPF